MRKLIAFDDETADQLTQLGKARMASWQDLADEAFADLLTNHGVPIDLKDALRKSVGVLKKSTTEPSAPRGKRRAPHDRIATR